MGNPEVKEIVDPKHAEAKNMMGETPSDIHKKKIIELKNKGETGLKEIANSCMIVATIIATVAFAAAFTVPGGTKDDTGTPHFIQKVPFIIFVISDAIALASSSWSILTILTIYTTPYTDEDFVVLPRNVVFGLSTLFLSIAAVMVVFCATIFIVFKHGNIWVPTLASIIASLPVISFTKQHLQLFYGVARLTSENSFLSKPIEKRQDSARWNFLEECLHLFRYYFRECCSMFIYYCRECRNKLLSSCRDMCSKDM
ncbi:hypothetical protein Patl1_12376 [Pistacia atlantica]|uniref:Uncharacterized protein n=1 Tax=Pistacia atlantica TaxID=434234 RepID=A0ACC1A742_9ROSI|nr:hypothetical protein Patl1_12376 [Pistacia atlantica]